MKTMIIIFLFCSIAFTALLMTNTVSASHIIIYVNGSHGSDSWDGLSWKTAKLSIKNAVGTVSNDGTVKIANGVYTGTKNTAININKDVTITGQSKDGTIINGTNSAQIFYISSGKKAAFQNLTFKNGNATYGGIIGNTGNLIINNCIFRNNHATSGGVIYNKGNLTVSSGTFTSNTATYGGSIYTKGTSVVKVTVRGSTFKYNKAGQGGAIFNNGGSLNVDNNTFTNNSATVDDGGAILNCGPLTVTNSIFTNNTATGSTTGDGGGGSAIHNYGTSIITNSSFIRNKADHGGAIDDVVLSRVYTSTVANCSFYYNSAVSQGGVIITNNSLILTSSKFVSNHANYGGVAYNLGKLTFKSSNFTGNSATTNGGVVYNRGTAITLTSSTLTGNTATYGGVIYNRIGTLTANFNRFDGNTATTGRGKNIYRYSGTANTELNWWGSNSGPSGSIIGYTLTTWFVLHATASPRSMDDTTTSTITVNLIYDNKGVYHSPISGRVPDGTPVSFATTLGSIKSRVSTVNGTAKSILTSRTNRTTYVTVTLDSQKISIPINVY